MSPFHTLRTALKNVIKITFEVTPNNFDNHLNDLSTAFKFGNNNKNTQHIKQSSHSMYMEPKILTNVRVLILIL